MPAPNAAALIRRNGTDPDIASRPAIRFGGDTWTWADYYRASCAWAGALRAAGARHVGVLLDNTPTYLFVFGGAALSGCAVVGLNHTRRGEHLQRDIRHTDVDLVVTEPGKEELLGDADPGAPVWTLGPADLPPSPGGHGVADDPRLEPDPGTTWALIFTSGTSSAPKAVICSQRRLLTTGVRMGMILGIGPDDVGYVCMPLFHSNAVMVGWAPALVVGASVGLARRFSASGWLGDVRRYGATWWNYTGKPLAYILATPEHPGDADNPLRVAYGNEGSQELVARFAARFGVHVIDAYGATEGGVAVDRDAPPRKGALGRIRPGVMVVDDAGNELPRARIDAATGRLLNAEACVGEIVNTAGAGPFEGYYNNPEATERTTRNGWYWSGDLGYVDDDGYIYFAGRTGDWARVDGENFPLGPIEAALAGHREVLTAAAYAVPDAEAGDQVMVAVVLQQGAAFDGDAFAAWLDSLPDIGPKWRPRYVRVASSLPTTGTNKVLVRALSREKWRVDDPVYRRDRADAGYRRLDPADVESLEAAFVANGRERFLDL